MVIWLIGKSGAGKTSIGRALYQKLKAKLPNTIFLDGDALRTAIGEDLGYGAKDRYISERRTSRLCKLLADQGHHVICAKLSNSSEIRAWNRRQVPDYYEIYVRTDEAVLEAHDEKGLYQGFRRGEVRNVVGMDIPFHEPAAPWMTVDNNHETCVERIASDILVRLGASSI